MIVHHDKGKEKEGKINKEKFIEICSRTCFHLSSSKSKATNSTARQPIVLY